ncbi:MAG: cohesin domain-containing protein, partial [Nitrososphaerota archaeon]
MIKLYKGVSKGFLVILTFVLSVITPLAITNPIPAIPAMSTALVKVEPAWNEFGSANGENIVGARFTVTVTVYDVPALYGYDLKFRWNNTYINYVNHTVHAKWTLKLKDDPYPTEGWYWIAYSKMAPESPASGTVPIFSMTFEIIKQP